MGDVSGRFKIALLAGASGLLAFSGAARAQEAVDENVQTGVTALSLGRVVVSAGAEKVAIDTPQAVTVLDQDDIDNAQASTMGELLDAVPGVSIVGGTSALGQGFNIRGLGQDLAESDSRILFQVDGVTKFFEQYRMGQLFSEPDLYKRVEVLRGPASSTLYGAGAIAGVVNFTTKDASDFLEGDDAFAVRLRGGYESNAQGGFGSAIFAVRPIDNLDVLFMANRREVDHYQNGDGEVINPSNASSDSQLLKARYYFGGDRAHNIWASYQVWNSDSTQVYDQAEAGASGGAGPVRRDVEDTTATLGYENGFAGNDWLDFKAQFSYAMSDVFQTDTTFLGATLESSRFSYESWQGRLENTSELKFGDDWVMFVTTGLQGSYQERRNPRIPFVGAPIPGTTSHPEGDMTRYGVFAQAELVWDDRLTIIPGVRYDRSEYEPGGAGAAFPASTAAQVTRDGVSPKLALMYDINDWLGVFGSVAHTVRLPVIDEIFSRSGSGATARAYSPDLRPEESDNYELGFTLGFRDVIGSNDAMNFKFTAFRNEISDLIITAANAGVPAPSTFFVNVGESLIEGYEIEAEYGAESWFARLGYSAIEGTNELNNQPLNSIPAHELHLTIGYLVPSLDLTLGWSGLFAADQHRVPTSTPGAVPRAPTDDYSVHNLFATWRPDEGVLSGTELRLAVDNVTDEQYQPHLSSIDAEGRSFKVSVARTF